jgi:hypothetical protein
MAVKTGQIGRQRCRAGDPADPYKGSSEALASRGGGAPQWRPSPPGAARSGPGPGALPVVRWPGHSPGAPAGPRTRPRPRSWENCSPRAVSDLPMIMTGSPRTSWPLRSRPLPPLPHQAHHRRFPCRRAARPRLNSFRARETGEDCPPRAVGNSPQSMTATERRRPTGIPGLMVRKDLPGAADRGMPDRAYRVRACRARAGRAGLRCGWAGRGFARPGRRRGGRPRSGPPCRAGPAGSARAGPPC